MPKSVEPLARNLSRSQVAHLLGVSDRDVRRMDGKQLHPTRAPDRVWRYDAAEVRALLAPFNADTAARARFTTDGDTTAAVFALIEEGKTAPQIVIATKQKTEVVNHLCAEHAAMTGAVTLSISTVEALAKLLGGRISSEAGLLDSFRRALDARFEEGRAEAEDFGEIMDPATGVLRKLTPARQGFDMPRNASTTGTAPNAPTINKEANAEAGNEDEDEKRADG